MTLWHERDISHSSVERVFAPDATIVLDLALHNTANLISDMVIYPDAMRPQPSTSSVASSIRSACCWR